MHTVLMEGAWGYLLGALVTALSLLFNQWRSDRRDQARMEHERQQAQALQLSQQAEEQARWAREDARRWVAEHRQASLDLLEKLEPWVQHLRSWGHPFPHDTTDEIEAQRQDLRRYDWKQASHDVGQAWATLQLVGSDPVRDAFKALQGQMYVGIALTLDPINQDQLDNCVNEINARYERLLRAIRSDLGVTAPQQRDGAVQQRSTATTSPPADPHEPQTTS
ncbi:hypothetical protein ABZS71_34880 [Streptomyces sp. NPDC005393]|uniref:hypothetical protein n=1 Tax=Streptomyces sp. NPDC005393 TaxID=3157041 RepID=UPI0033A3BC27